MPTKPYVHDSYLMLPLKDFSKAVFGEEIPSFDEHAFVVKKGERLRVDISSSAHPYYVRHTNNRGLFSEQTTAKVADKTVILDKSTLTIYTE